jgi:DNA-binding NarL/FixJ family response regulator
VISVLLADDESLMRAGLRLILQAADDITVVGEADDGQQAVDAARRDRPDVVLMDIRMPRLDGLAATAQLRALPRPPAVVVLTTFAPDEHVFGALEAGACGFLLKDTAPRDLIAAVRHARDGEAVLSPGVTRRLIDRFAVDAHPHRQDALTRLETLTGREREILLEVGLGRTNAQIAAALHLSEATVKTHVTRLFEKLGATNRVQVAITAHRAGVVR